jgi:hypothetical protein
MARRKSKVKSINDGAAIVRALRRAVEVADSALKELSDGPPKRRREKTKSRTKGR